MNRHAVKKSWRQRPWPSAIEEKSCRDIAAELQIPLPIASILCQRGFSSAQQIDLFLNPALNQLPSPDTMQGMPQAVAIIAEAVTVGKPIAVFGDYDVDGVTGAAVLFLFMKSLGLDVFCYQPDRLTEGYGLNENGIKKLYDSCDIAARGGVLLTVDCGISDVAAVRLAKQLGFTVIITDHHEPPPRLPDADVILNPLQPGCPFPFKGLAGVGVAFYFIMGIRSCLNSKGFWRENETPNLKAYLDLVALGTIADMVPLQGVNRIFVKAGLEVLGKKQRPGLLCLSEVSGLTGRTPTAEDIAFRLGPRLNAAGRNGVPDKALRLLITTSMAEARQLAVELDEANNKRKKMEQQLLAEALQMAEHLINNGTAQKSLVLNGAAWHHGIIGIVAARLTDRFYRPTVLLSVNDGVARGSARSIPGLHLHEALTACADLLEQYGGHAGAAGMTLPAKNIDKFRVRFEAQVAKMVKMEDLKPKLWIDWHNSIKDIAGRNFLSYYSKLSPFGVGNPEPVFTSGKTSFVKQQVVGEQHLRFSLHENGINHKGIGFGFGYLAAAEPESLDLAFNLRLNEFRGEKNWELNLVDVKTFTTA